MICNNCNSELKENSNFCTVCGTKVGEYNLKVTRQKKTFGFAISFKVLVDNIEIGTLQNGSSFSYPLQNWLYLAG